MKYQAYPEGWLVRLEVGRRFSEEVGLNLLEF